MVSPNIQKIFIIIFVLFILSMVGYSTFKNASTGPVVANNSEVPGQDILVLVDKLNKISIDQSIFSSDLFTNLKDFSFPLTPEQPGRLNPFAPIGFDTQSITSATSTRGVTR